MNKNWFKAKIYGWGWYPATWQGWVVILSWMVIFVTIISNLVVNSFKYWLAITSSISILIYICYKTGEKPGWRWGKKNK
jgi:hypothetical protein